MGKDQPQRPENQQNVILFCSFSTRVHEIYQTFLTILFPQLLEQANCKKKCLIQIKFLDSHDDGYGQESTTKAGIIYFVASLLEFLKYIKPF